MKLNILDFLTLDPTDSNFIDLTQTTFIYDNGNSKIQFFPYVVQREDEMRLWSISKKIYQTENEMDFLMELNSITMPFNVSEGDVLFYCDLTNRGKFKPQEVNIQSTLLRLIDLNKKKQVDPARQRYLDDINTKLPPAFNEVQYNPIKINNGTITIGQGIFDQ